MKKEEKQGISVIIPTFNRAKLLYPTLICLLNQKHVSCDYEIIIIDSGNDGTDKLVYNIPNPNNVVIIYNQVNNHGNRSLLRNYGANISNYNILVFLDNDMLVPQNFITFHYNFHQNNEAVVVGLRTLLTEFNIQDFEVENLISNFDSLQQLPAIDDNRKREFQNLPNALIDKWRFVYTNNLSIKKKVFFDNGMFNEEFGNNWGYEDIEFGIRLTKNSIPIHIDNTLDLYHQPHFAQSKQQQLLGFENQKLMIKLHNFYEVEFFILFQDDYMKYHTDMGKLCTPKLTNTSVKFDVILGYPNSINSPQEESDTKFLLGIYITHLLNENFDNCLIHKTFFSFSTTIKKLIFFNAFRIARNVYIQTENNELFENECKKLAILNDIEIQIIHYENLCKVILLTKLPCKKLYVMAPHIFESRNRALFIHFAAYLHKHSYDIVLDDITKIENPCNEEYGIENDNSIFYAPAVEKFLNKRIALLPESLISQGFPLFKNNYEKIIGIDDYKFKEKNEELSILSKVFLINNKNYFFRVDKFSHKYHFCCFMLDGYLEDGIDIILDVFAAEVQENPQKQLVIKIPNEDSYYEKIFPMHNMASKNTKSFNIRNKIKMDKLLLSEKIYSLNLEKNVVIYDSILSIQKVINLIASCSTFICANRSFQTPIEVYIAALLSKRVLLANQLELPKEISENVEKVTTQFDFFINVFDVPVNSKNANLRVNNTIREDLKIKMKLNSKTKNIQLDSFFRNLESNISFDINSLLYNSLL